MNSRVFVGITRFVSAIVFAVAVGAEVRAQEVSREVRLADFDALVSKLEANYAGWETKVTPQTRAAFDQVVATQRRAAEQARDDQAFLVAAQGLLKFFADGHLSIRATTPPEAAARGELPSTPKTDLTEAVVKERLDAAGAAREQLEGIWETLGGRHRVGILKNKDGGFPATVLATQAENWSVGMVKAEFKGVKNGAIAGVWRMGDHSTTEVVGEFLAEGVFAINAAGGTFLQRVYPPAKVDVLAAARTVAWPEVFYHRLSERTAWLRLPSFDDSVGPKLTAILQEKHAELATIENLIIDIRNNGGGSDYVYGPLMPMIYSRPVYSVGIQIKCSADNIASWEALLENPEIPAEQRDGLRKRIDAMRAHMGGYFTPEPSFETEVLPEVKPFPRRVAVLVQGAASSGEQFILEAMQSRKVTMFGKGPSAGVLDFANVRSFSLPSGRFSIGNPTSRSLRLPSFPVDPNGIAPDEKIPEGEKDEIGYVQKWLER